MYIYQYYTSLWAQDAIPFEYPACKLLRKNPIKKNVKYLAMPWALLIDYNRLHLVPNIKLNGGFTITRSVRFEEIIPILKQMGINVLFTPHAIGKKYDGVEVLPMPHFNLNGVNPAKNKDIFYSFIGSNDHLTRRKIFETIHPKNAVIIKRQTLHFFIDIWEKSKESKLRKENEKIEYQDILARSRFSLCPSGKGPGTLRFWESLQAGAIPVIISDDNLVLPNGFDWDSCVIKIVKKDIKNIAHILGSISNKKEQEMRKNCLRAYKLYSNDNLIRVIKDYYEK